LATLLCKLPKASKMTIILPKCLVFAVAIIYTCGLLTQQLTYRR
jgi:hypothetical protein